MTSGSQSKGSNAPPTNNALPEYLFQHLSIYNLMALYKYTFTISIIDIIISRCGPTNVQKTAVFSLIMFRFGFADHCARLEIIFTYLLTYLTL